MVEFPPEIMYDIFSRMPVNSLARCRCVSKLWCNYINDSYLHTIHAKRAHPTVITFSQFPSDDPPNSPCTLSFLEYKEEDKNGSRFFEMRKKPPAMEFMCRTWEHDYPKDIVLGSCNGLLYSSQGRLDAATLVVIHPLRRECYELPPMNPLSGPEPLWNLPGVGTRSCAEWSCGLGFDDVSNTFKMVCVVPRNQVQLEFHPVKDPCTMVHVLGTRSWRKIPLVPTYAITGEGVFANGCLHWLASRDHGYLVRFAMNAEKFGLIKSPRKRTTGEINVHLVNLHGQVGFVYTVMDFSVEVWVLKGRGWVMHCKFELKAPLPNGFVKVLGFWNEDGDILMIDNWGGKWLCVYNLKSDSSYKVNIVGLEERGIKDIRMYQDSLFSADYSIKY